MSSLQKKPFFYGWVVVFACAIIQFYIGGTFFQGFSALFNPVADEFGWSYALVSLAFTFRGFESGIVAPAVGFLADRFGPRKILIIGVIITGSGFWLFSLVQSVASFYGAFLFLALGLSFTTGVVTMSAVVKWFGRRSGLALGILTAGFGASGLLMPLVVQLVDSLGWREAVFVFALGTGVISLPLALIVKDPPEQIKIPKHNDPVPAEVLAVQGMAASDIVKSRDFWVLSLAILFGGLAGQAIIVHQIPYMESIGITRQTAGIIAVVFSCSNITGRVLFGILGDRLEKRRCFAICVVIKAIGVFGFAVSSSVGQFIPSMIALGIGFGGLIPLRPSLQIEFFGFKSFATVQGLLMISVTVGTMVSPVFAGWVFDSINSYRPAFISLAAITLSAVPLVLAARSKFNSRTALSQSE